MEFYICRVVSHPFAISLIPTITLWLILLVILFIKKGLYGQKEKASEVTKLINTERRILFLQMIILHTSACCVYFLNPKLAHEMWWPWLCSWMWGSRRAETWLPRAILCGHQTCGSPWDAGSWDPFCRAETGVVSTQVMSHHNTPSSKRKEVYRSQERTSLSNTISLHSSLL